MKTNHAEKELLITHLFNAPVDVVFRAWTEPEYLKRWFAPDDCTIEYKFIEVKENGIYHSCLHDPVHGNCWIKGVYREIIPSGKLVFSTVLTNENGDDVQSAEVGKPERWPSEIMTTVTFTAFGNQTKVVVHQTVSEVEAQKTGAYQGWIKMFNRLNTLLLNVHRG